MAARQRGRVMIFTDARSLLFVPGHRPDRFSRARDSGADGIIIDLEDAVGQSRKDEARESARQWLAGGGDAVVRINAADTPWFDADVDAVLQAAPAATIMLPKATPASVEATGRRLPSEGRLVALVETAAGVLDAAAIAHSRPVGRIAFGNVDLSTELGVDPDDHRSLLWARSTLVVASAAAGIAPPIDGVTTSLHDDNALRADTASGRALGFTGKLCIHPDQVVSVHQVFDPSPTEVEYAERVLAAAVGDVSVLDGKMLDRPVIERARRIVRRATHRE